MRPKGNQAHFHLLLSCRKSNSHNKQGKNPNRSQKGVGKKPTLNKVSVQPLQVSSPLESNVVSASFHSRERTTRSREEGGRAADPRRAACRPARRFGTRTRVRVPSTRTPRVSDPASARRAQRCAARAARAAAPSRTDTSEPRAPLGAAHARGAATARRRGGREWSGRPAQRPGRGRAAAAGTPPAAPAARPRDPAQRRRARGQKMEAARAAPARPPAPPAGPAQPRPGPAPAPARPAPPPGAGRARGQRCGKAAPGQAAAPPELAPAARYLSSLPYRSAAASPSPPPAPAPPPPRSAISASQRRRAQPLPPRPGPAATHWPPHTPISARGAGRALQLADAPADFE